MSIDQVLRAIGALACMYTVGLFVTVLSIASINAAGYSTASMCGLSDCSTTVAYHHPTLPEAGPVPDVLASTAVVLAANF